MNATPLLLMLLASALGAMEVTELSELPASEREARLQTAFTAAREVSWPAGSYASERLLTALDPNGTSLLLELGGIPGQTVETDAFSGDWWQGLMVACRACKLAPLGTRHSPAISPGRQPSLDRVAFSHGPLLLRQAELPQLQACGPLLLEWLEPTRVQLTGLQGSSTQALLHYRLHLRPDLPGHLVDEATVSWSEARSPEGEVLLEQQRPNDALEEILLAPAQRAEPNPIHLRLPKQQVRHIELTGTCELVCTQQQSVNIILTNTTTELTIAGQVILIEREHERQRHHDRVTIDIPDALAVQPETMLLLVDGVACEQIRHGFELSPTGERFQLAFATPDEGERSLHFAYRFELGRVQIPLVAEVTIP